MIRRAFAHSVYWVGSVSRDEGNHPPPAAPFLENGTGVNYAAYVAPDNISGFPAWQGDLYPSGTLSTVPTGLGNASSPSQRWVEHPTRCKSGIERGPLSDQSLGYTRPVPPGRQTPITAAPQPRPP